MGQKPSHVGSFENTLPISWLLRKDKTTHNPNPAQPIKFQYKTRRKNALQNNDKKESKNNENKDKIKTQNISNDFLLNNNTYKRNQSVYNLSQVKSVNNVKCNNIVKAQKGPIRTKSEPNLHEKQREKRKYKRRSHKKPNWDDGVEQFGYEIEDVDSFLAKASIEKPANIPVVLAFPSVLYQTRIGGYQDEISLPLGMVVNAVFKNQHWLYVQTPHAEEGYISYAACLPLGIIPRPEDTITPSPCWDTSTDIFPQPSGNLTDTEKLSECGERRVDALYLRAARKRDGGGARHTLCVVHRDYQGPGENTLGVVKGEVVVLLDTPCKGWFWVRNRRGEEGCIPCEVAGWGFL